MPVLAVAAAAPAIAPPPEPAQLTLTADECARPDCTLTFTFSHAIVDDPKHAREPALQFAPRLKGRFAWISDRVLTFKPSRPLEVGEEVVVTAKNVTARDPAVRPLVEQTLHILVSELMIAGKVVEWPVRPGLPRLVTALTNGAEFGASGLFLVFDQPVDPAALKKRIRVVDMTSRKAVPFSVSRPETTGALYSAPLDLTLVARLTFPRVAHQQELQVSVPSWDPSEDRPTATLETQIFTAITELGLTSTPDFALNRAPLSATLAFTATTPLDEPTFGRALSIEPKPLSTSVQVWGSEVAVTLELAPGTSYKAVVDGAQDVLGNRSKRMSLSFRSQDLTPEVFAPEVPVAVEKAAARLPVRVVNSGPLTASIHRTDVTNFVATEALASCDGELLATRRVPVKLALNERGVVDVPLDGLRGYLCVRLDAEGRGSEKQAVAAVARAQSSNVAATVKLLPRGVLVWATHLDDGSVAAKARVEVFRDGTLLVKGVTDDDGLVQLSLPAPSDETAGRPLFVVVSQKGDAAVTTLDDGTLSHAWQFGLAEEAATPKLDAALFTERGVYRPGETVHVKAILPGAGAVQLRVTDARGQTVTEKKLAVDPLGGAQLDVELSQKAAVGAYTVRLTRDGRATTRSFQVQEYRVPGFEVKTSSGDAWRDRQEVSAVVVGKYFHGAPLAGREVKWTLYGEPETFAPTAFPGWVFTPPEGQPRTAELASGEGKLDGSGQLEVKLTPRAFGSPVRHVLEATVTDVDRQTWTSRLARVVHPAELYVGVRPPPRAVLQAGDALEVPVVVVTPDEVARPGVEVEVALEQVEYASVTRLLGTRGWLTSERDNVRRAKRVDGCRVVSSSKPESCKLTLRAPGSYRVVARAGGVQSAFTVSAAGGGVVAWPRFDRERIDLVVDRPARGFHVGDVARVVVQTPFESAKGLLTVEAGGVLTRRLFDISRDTPGLEVPITEQMVPNAFVSVVLLRGRVHHEKDAAGYETGAPAFRLGYAKLDVDPSSERLAVRVAADEVARPRAVVQLEVQVRDAAKAPVPGAVALAVVDEAVLGLTGHRTPDPVAELHAPRALAVRTADGRLDLVHSRRSRQEALFPGGDGDSELFSRILTGDLRNLFQSTAYWNPNVAVGADGVARVSVTLPDNLTTWRVMAVAYDGHGRAGSAERKVVVRKPLMVQPVLPRFVYPGDTLTVEALVFNGTAQAGEVTVSAMALEGLDAAGAALVQRRQLKGGESVKLGVPVKVTGRGKAKVRFAAQLGAERDEFEVTLPILDAGAKRVVVASAQVTSPEGALEVPLPAGRNPGTTEVEVMVSQSALSELKDSVQYLMQYPHGCIEQTTSTAYPLVVLEDLLPEMGVTVDAAELKKMSEAGVKRLLSFQTSSGGLAYWPGSDTPHAFGTTFGLTALIEAKKRGYQVPDEALAKAATYLERTLRQGVISEEMPHAGSADGDTRALMVLTLNRLHRPQPSYVSSLWRERAKLSVFGVAMLAVTVSEGGGDRALLEPMLAEVQAQAKKSETQAWFEGDRASGWSMGSPLRTHAAALLAYGTGGTKSDLGGKFLTGLLKRKTAYGVWGNTQENVYGIMGVAKLVGRGAGGEAPKATLTVQGAPVDLEQLEKVSTSVRRLTTSVKEEARGVKVALRKQGGAPTFLTVRARYEVPLTGEHRAAYANGFQVKRSYETLEGQSLEGRPIPLGAVVRVRVSVESAAKRNYVAVDDKLPAGLEPLNASLATTERLSLGEATPATTRGLEVLSFQEMRDARVAFFADELPAGAYEWVYLARATTPGRFVRPAASVEAMYEPQVNGATSIEDVVVAPPKQVAGRRR